MDTIQFLLFSTAVFAFFFFLRTTVLKNNDPPPPPGPRRLPIIGHLHLLTPLLHRTFHRLSEKYGPLVQLHLGSVPCVVASTPELAREFLRTNELVFSSRKHSTAVDVITYGSSFAFSPYGPYWKYVKKLCTYELLGARNLNHFQSIRVSEVNRFLKAVAEKAEKTGELFNVTEELVKLTNNVISNTMLGIRCEEEEEAMAVIREVTRIFGEFDVSDVVWFCKKFDFQGIRRRSEEIRRRYDGLLERIISGREEKRRIQGGATAADFLDLLLDIVGKTDVVTFTRDHLKALILDFFTAGTDTTAIATEWAISELINNPSVMAKAQEEIDEVIGTGRLLRETDGPDLPYLQAIIKETFRLHPPIPMLTRKSTADCAIGGYRIPAKTLLFVNIWSIGRNPKYWENPTEFIPERFLRSGIDVKGQDFELLPFGTGRRGCPGMILAMNELVGIIGTMVQCFNWSSGDVAPVDMAERPGLTAPRAHNLFCRVSPRINLGPLIN